MNPTPEAQRRYVRNQLENAEWWERQALNHESSADRCRKNATNCRDEAAYYEDRASRGEYTIQAREAAE